MIPKMLFLVLFAGAAVAATPSAVDAHIRAVRDAASVTSHAMLRRAGAATSVEFAGRTYTTHTSCVSGGNAALNNMSQAVAELAPDDTRGDMYRAMLAGIASW